MPEEHPSRLESLASRASSAFRREFTGTPRLAYAPGRVDLLGSHTDYNGYPVLSFAIDRGIVLAFTPRKDRRVRLSNIAPAFPAREFEIEDPLPPHPTGDWANYVKAGISGLLPQTRTVRGFDAVCGGDIPIGAGLSSSTALVVAGAIVLAAVNEIPWVPLALAETLARAEHYVGTQGGGMDQATSLCAHRGHVAFIEFFPLRARSIPAPPFEVVIAHSLRSAVKTGEAMGEYNRRVVECRLAAALVARALGLPDNPEMHLADLERAGPAEGELVSLAETVLAPWILGPEEIARRLGMPEDILRDRYLKTCDLPRLKLLPRLRHVVTEAGRVRKGAQALTDGDLQRLGRLLHGSFTSSRDDYEISTPDLNRLTTLAGEAGALGSRIAGAGFGGATVNLLRPGESPGFIDALERTYYGGKRRTIDEPVFAAVPSRGAGLMEP